MKEYYRKELSKLVKFTKADINLVNSLGNSRDIQAELSKLKGSTRSNTKVLIVYYNRLWEPIVKIADLMGWRKDQGEQNWLDENDLGNLCFLSGWELVSKGKRLLLPIDIPIVSRLVNKWLAPLPVINNLCLVTWIVAKPRISIKKNYSVSIVVPARNEEGNIDRIVRSIPRFGKWQELIFVEGGSSDKTWEKIKQKISPFAKALRRDKQKFRIKAFRQRGKGKADAVRLGFSKAKGDVLMILDADLTVDPKDLIKFYNVIGDGLGEFANGSRLVYPMEKEAMRLLNIVGNKVFGWLFTYILGQRFKDTLCGTKVLLRTDYLKISKARKFFGDFDPFGDFDLIFGAVKQNLKVVEVPIRYRERTYGTTNISRFTHGWLLLKMTAFAFLKFKAW